PFILSRGTLWFPSILPSFTAGEGIPLSTPRGHAYMVHRVLCLPQEGMTISMCTPLLTLPPPKSSLP
ncbi:MAG: hypothetical protein FWH55_15005, partial [Oscillospiraceae bacterium]|nr:hypothetical protein [Oscillospiraceae bacterium]